MRTLLIILCLLGVSCVGVSQRTSEVGPFLGGAYYLGDLNNNKHFYMSRPAFGMVHRYILNSHFSLKNSFLYGTVAGDDSKSKNLNQIAASKLTSIRRMLALSRTESSKSKTVPAVAEVEVKIKSKLK